MTNDPGKRRHRTDVDAFVVAKDDDRQVNPIGVEGVGEVGTIGATAAVAHAAYQATGKRFRDLPVTPDRLL